MTRVIDDKGESLINSLATVGDSNFDYARSFVESKGFHLIKDGLELKEWCEDQAKSGNLGAQHALSEFLYVGLFGKQDKLAAYNWCSEAAGKGHIPSIFMLAGFVEEGFISPIPDAETAFELTSLAAKKGYVHGLRSLGVMYLTGSGVAIDSKKAYEYFEKAAKAGDSYSQFMLGTMLLDIAEPDEIAAGIDWLRASANQGFPSALLRLAHFYSDGSYGIIRDKDESARYYAEAEIAEKSKKLSS